jgi:multidrug resistance protein, MATE family
MAILAPRIPWRVRSHPAFPTGGDAARLLRLSGPIVVVQLGMMAMGVVATVLVGHLSDAALGGVALGNLYLILVLLLAWGTLLAIDPIVSQAVGAGDQEGRAIAVQRGGLLAAGLAVVASLACLPVKPVLEALGQPAEILPLAERYVLWSVPGLLPFLLFIVLRHALQAMEHTREIVLVIVLANVLHLVLCWALVFGRLGLPALGVVGAALAASITRGAMALAMLALAWPLLRPALLPLRRRALDPVALAHMLRIGLPIGGQMQLEYGIFAVVGVFIGRLGTVPIDAHQIALMVASLTFMVPQGIGSAAAVLTGQAVGAADAPRARRAAAASVGAGAAFMALAALVLWLGAHPLAGWFSDDPAVVRAAAMLLPVAGAFQVFDGVQVVSIGVLRGLGDTRTPVVVNLLGFWLVGLPVSLLLGFGLHGGATGLWWGLVVGMAVVAVALLVRLDPRLVRPVAPVRVRETVAG